MASIDYAILVGYLLLMIGLGVYFQSRKAANLNAYFLGERGIPWWLLGVSGMASNLDVAGTMIICALLFSLGMSGFFVEVRGGVVIILAFLMIFMGKWNRRAQVMTLAEWMHFRFGSQRDGQIARLISAISAVVMTAALVTYFCIGTGKFVTEFFPVPALFGINAEFWAALILISLAMLYTVAAGLRGVVYADAIRSVITFSAIILACYLCMTTYSVPDRFELSVPVNDAQLEQYNASHPDNRLLPGYWTENRKYTLREMRGKKYLVWETTREEWTSVLPPRKFDFPDVSDFAMFNLITLAIIFYMIRSTLDGLAGSTGHMAQRFFAAKSDREASLLSLLWTCLLAFRWPFVAAVAVMGISVTLEQGVGDPEKVLPVVVNTVFPAGLKGLLVAGLLAAAMSTFDATINAGAAYWVKDVYHAFIAKNASEKQLVFQGRMATVMIVAVALLASLLIKNVNEIWGFFTMAITAGLFIPLVIRWFWWRLNGWGFAAGTGAGLLAALVQKLVLPARTPEFVPFLIVSVASLAGLIVITLLTEQTDPDVLLNFYRKTRPFGLWGPVRDRFPVDVLQRIRRENRRDILATPIAFCWQLSLFLTLMTLVLRRWDHFGYLLAVLATSSIGLYFVWYRHLGDEVQIESTAGQAPSTTIKERAPVFAGIMEHVTVPKQR